jgi:glycosyltransferase involved in cell wall biosynthesis
MQILHVSSFAPPHLGGLETCAEGLFRELAESGLSIQWLFSNVPRLEAAPNTVRIDVWNSAEKRFGIPIPIPKPDGIRRLWECVREADLVHVHDVMYLTSFWAVVFARVLKKRVVVTLHIWKVPYRSVLVRGLQHVAHYFVGQFCLKSASAVVTYNRQIFILARRYLDEDRVHFVPNGISRTFLQPGFELSAESQARLRASLGLPLNTKIAIFAGRFVEKKGLSRIHSMAKRFPGVLFLFCGTGPDNPTEWRYENVTVLGLKTALQLQELFYASDILLLPSVGEGFPLVIQEAMACGLPCLVLEETWASWGRDRSLFVVAHHEDLETTLGSYLENPFPIALRRDIQKFSNATWNWTNSAAEYRKIYDSLVAASLFNRAICALRSDE